jgi:hypothetical protein
MKPFVERLAEREAQTKIHGVMPHLPEGKAGDWANPRVRHELRLVLLTVDHLYRALGAHCAHVVRMYGDEPPFSHGIAADLSLRGLPGVVELNPSKAPPPIVQKLCDQLCAMMPREDGMESATADGATLRIRLPVNGLPRSGNAFADWPLLGATGIERDVEIGVNSLEGAGLKRNRKDFWR